MCVLNLAERDLWIRTALNDCKELQLLEWLLAQPWPATGALIPGGG